MASASSDEAVGAGAEIEMFEPEREQAPQGGGIGYRARRAEGDARTLPVAAERRECDAACTEAITREQGGKLRRQPVGDMGKGALVQRLGALEAGGVARGGTGWADRLERAAERRVEARQQHRGEAPRQPGPAAAVEERVEVADMAQAEGVKRLGGGGIEPERGHRQGRERRAFVTGRAERGLLHGAGAGERPGRPRRGGETGARGDAGAGEAGEDRGHHGGLAAEQMGAAGHFEPDSSNVFQTIVFHL